MGKSQSIKLTLNKKADKKTTISVKSSNAKVAKVSKSSVTVKKGKKVSTAFKVTGKKAGNATITVSFTNSKGKKVSKKISVKVVNKAAADDTKTPTDDTKTPTEDTTVTEATATTTAEVASALANTKLTKLTIATEEAANIEIPAGDYSKVALVVNASKASVKNAGTFKSIQIDAIAANTWYEKAVGNVITVIAKIARIVAQKGSSIKSVTVAAAGTKAATDVVKIEAEAGSTVSTIDVARDGEMKTNRRREYLKLAFDKFEAKAEADHAETFIGYDGKNSIHYFSEDWVGRLMGVMDKSDEMYGRVKDCYDRMKS